MLFKVPLQALGNWMVDIALSTLGLGFDEIGQGRVNAGQVFGCGSPGSDCHECGFAGLRSSLR